MLIRLGIAEHRLAMRAASLTSPEQISDSSDSACFVLLFILPSFLFCGFLLVFLLFMILEVTDCIFLFVFVVDISYEYGLLYSTYFVYYSIIYVLGNYWLLGG